MRAIGLDHLCDVTRKSSFSATFRAPRVSGLRATGLREAQ